MFWPMRMRPAFSALLLVLGLTAGCSEAESATPEMPAPVVRGDGEGFVLTWFDEEGPHIAESRETIPTDHRGRVRVDPLDIPPDQRDPDHVWLANLRDPSADGSYQVERVTRDAFDAILDERSGVAFAEPEDPATGAQASADIIIYGASWCHACRSAASYLRSRNVPFVERDIEAEPGARAEMQQKARAAGISPGGIPVIDFRGTMLTGFDQRRMDSLLAGG